MQYLRNSYKNTSIGNLKPRHFQLEKSPSDLSRYWPSWRLLLTLLTFDKQPLAGKKVTLIVEPSPNINVSEGSLTDENGQTITSFISGTPGVYTIKEKAEDKTLNASLAAINTGSLQPSVRQ